MSYFSVRGTILQCFKDNIDQILWYILLNLTLWHLVNAGKAKTPLPQNLPSCGLHLLKELPTPQAVTLLCYLGHNNQSQLLLHSYQLTVNCSPPPPPKNTYPIKDHQADGTFTYGDYTSSYTSMYLLLNTDPISQNGTQKHSRRSTF